MIIRSRLSALLQLILPLTLVCIPAAARAETDPTQTLQQLVKQMKETGSAAAVVNYVDWESAFTTLPAPQKEQLKVTTPDEMKTFFKKLLESPSSMMRKQLEEKIPTLPAEQQAQAKSTVERLDQVLKQKEADLNKRLKETDYTVGKAAVEGDTAKVDLTQTFKGESKTESVTLHKAKDGRWLLPSLAMVGGTKNPSGNSAPVGPPSDAAVAPAPDGAPAASTGAPASGGE